MGGANEVANEVQRSLKSVCVRVLLIAWDRPKRIAQKNAGKSARRDAQQTRDGESALVTVVACGNFTYGRSGEKRYSRPERVVFESLESGNARNISR